MRSAFGAFVLIVLTATTATAQLKEEREFGLLFNPDLYPQDTPRQTLGSFLRVLDRDRLNYATAFLLDREYIREQMQVGAAEYDRAARAQVDAEMLQKKGFEAAFIRDRIRDLAINANFENLVQRIKAKLADDPESVKELRKFFREGELVEAAETASLKHPDIKDRQLFFRNVRGRWYIENKMQP